MKEEQKTGTIVCSRKGFFDVSTPRGVCVCKAATRLRREKKEPLCGDVAVFTDNGDGTGFITDILPRRCCFPRPSVANADVFCIVISAHEPEPDLYCVDILTCLGAKYGVDTVIIINKCDLSSGDEYARIYSACGFEVFRTGIGGEGSDELRRRLKGALAVFAGASGVGKSSLLNRLYPQYAAKTGELSSKIARGKNTTRHTELFATGDGGYIADTPGFSALDPETEDLLVFDDLEYCFPEFQPYFGKCRFRGCGHTKEIGCAVIDAVGRGEIPVSRHESYKKLFEVLKKKTQY